VVASVHAGHARAIHALARFRSASRRDPLYEAIVPLCKLLRTVFLADYFVNATFRRELLRVVSRGEAVNALKRAIYAGRIAVIKPRATTKCRRLPTPSACSPTS
jgi:TnpA family transposase